MHSPRPPLSLLGSILLYSLHFAVTESKLFPFEEKQLLTNSLRSFTHEAHTSNDTKCKVFPGDANWPDESQWTALNKSTNGALIKTIPIAAPCYPGPLYNADRCAYITSQWSNSSIQYIPSLFRNEMMSPLLTNAPLVCRIRHR
jgi:hypothetical protein